MARLVAAFGTSHSPALNSPAQDMAGHARRDEMYQGHLDRDGNRVSYADLLARAPASLQEEITPEKLADRVRACERHIDRLAQAIVAARLDALVIVGDDQREQYLEDNQPAFLVYCGATIENAPLELPGNAPAYWQRARSQYHEPAGRRAYPVAADLALHLIEQLVAHDFDVACGKSLPRPRGEGHAFGFVHRRLLAGRTALPIVPLVVNTYYPPNQPRPARCHALGKALRNAIEGFDREQRVGVIASGGLSHFTVDEELDRAVLSYCRDSDAKGFAGIAPNRLNSGSSEIRNWIVTAGAAESLRTKWQEYVPLYRTPAGTGCGMAFAEWG
jgi:3-O-methylgallate 3,4-dioxygenase